MNNVLFSSERMDWETPQDLFDKLDAEFHFNLDVCAIPENAKCDLFFTKKDNGLIRNWSGGVCWLNPPYGSQTSKWLNRLMQHGKGIALVFARTDTGWFQGYASRADAICFINKRVQFVRAGQAEQHAKGLKVKNSGSGAGSLLIAYGTANAEALYKSHLGLTMKP